MREGRGTPRTGQEAAAGWAPPSGWRERAGATGTPAGGFVLPPPRRVLLGSRLEGEGTRPGAGLGMRCGLGSVTDPRLFAALRRWGRSPGGERDPLGCLERGQRWPGFYSEAWSPTETGERRDGPLERRSRLCSGEGRGGTRSRRCQHRPCALSERLLLPERVVRGVCSRNGNVGLERGVPRRVLSHHAGLSPRCFPSGVGTLVAVRDTWCFHGHLCGCRTDSLAVTASVS